MKLGPFISYDSSSLVRFEFDEQHGFHLTRAAENPPRNSGQYGSFKEEPMMLTSFVFDPVKGLDRMEYYHFDKKTRKLSHVFLDDQGDLKGEYADEKTEYQWRPLIAEEINQLSLLSGKKITKEDLDKKISLMPDRLFANIVEGDGEHLMNTDLLVAADIKTNLTEEQSLVVKDVIGRRLLKVKKTTGRDTYLRFLNALLDPNKVKSLDKDWKKPAKSFRETFLNPERIVDKELLVLERPLRGEELSALPTDVYNFTLALIKSELRAYQPYFDIPARALEKPLDEAAQARIRLIGYFAQVAKIEKINFFDPNINNQIYQYVIDHPDHAMSLAEKGVLNLLSDDQLMDLAKTFLRTSAGVEATAEATAEASSKEREGLFALVSQPKLWNRISAAMPKENTGFKAALLFGAKPSSKSLMSLVKEFNELYPELHPTLPPEFQDYLFSILAQNTFLLDEFIKNANPKKQEELAAVESVLSSLVSALSRYRGDQPGFVKASDAMIQNLLPMLLNLSSSEGPLSQIASKQLNRIVCLPWIAKQILLASGPSAESAEIESWARGLVKSEQWKRLVELVKEQNLTDKNRDLAAPIAIEVASNPKLYEQQVHKAAVKRLLNEQVSKGRDISNEFLKDYLDFYRAVAGSPDSKQYSPKVQNVVRKNFIRLLLLRSNSQYNRESIEEDIKLYGKFLLENVNFEQRSSFIDIVHNLYFPKEGQPKIPKDVAQVIADSSVGKFADDSQMSKKYTEEYIRKHQKYSEHVRLEALYQAPKAPDWLNDESAKSFLQTLESNPDRLSSHQLAEYFVYLSKQSNPADGYSALFRQLALAQNKTVVTLFRNYLAKYEGLSFNTPQNIADLKMALIANSNFRMLREITRVNLIKSVPLPYLKATLDTHRTGAGGAPDDFYKKLSESLLNNYPDIISQLSPENQQAIQAIRDKAPVPQPAAIVEAPKPQQVRLAEVAPGESEESRLRAHFSQLLTKYNAEYIKNLDPLRKNPLGKLFQVSAKHWPLAKKLQERINEILKKVNSEQTPAEALPALLPALWREFNTEISNYKDELVKGNSKRYLHELSTFQNREDIRIKKLELEDVFNRGAYQLAAGAGAGAGARARAAEEGHGSSSSPRP